MADTPTQVTVQAKRPKKSLQSTKSHHYLHLPQFEQFVQSSNSGECIAFLKVVQELKKRLEKDSVTDKKEIKELEREEKYQAEFKSVFERFVQVDPESTNIKVTFSYPIKKALEEESKAGNHFTLASFLQAFTEVEALMDANKLPEKFEKQMVQGAIAKLSKILAEYLRINQNDRTYQHNTGWKCCKKFDKKAVYDNLTTASKELESGSDWNKKTLGEFLTGILSTHVDQVGTKYLPNITKALTDSLREIQYQPQETERATP